VEQAGLTSIQESQLFEVLQRKAKHELQDLVASYQLEANLTEQLLTLVELNGGKDVLSKARVLFANATDAVKQALADLTEIADSLSLRFPQLAISFDLAELRGYHYHTGVVFAAFIPSVGREIARGGRYDNIGAAFGRARPATGFSADLKVLSALSKNHGAFNNVRERIFAPYAPADTTLAETIRDLRAQGHSVVQQLAGQTGGAIELGCTAVLELHQQQWLVTALA
jgi:ATP phosphoribosyltransferase regulatory subunit